MTFVKKNIPFKRNNPKPLKRNNHKNLNGFDNKVSRQRPKGNPLEVKGKYESLAKDASSAGDRIAAENYMQHAEHFLRVNNALKKSG